MKKRVATIIVTACALANIVTGCAVTNTAVAPTYSTEATMTRHKDKGTYDFAVRVSRLVERDGQLTEELIFPKLDWPLPTSITTSPGVPASQDSGFVIPGIDPKSPLYTKIKEECVNVDVSWPRVGKDDFAVCTTTVKSAGKIMSKTSMKVTVEGK